MKTSLFKHCLPTYSSKTFPSSQTKCFTPRSDYFFCRPRLVCTNSKTHNYLLRNQLRTLNICRKASLRLTTLSNFPGKIRLNGFKLVNLYKNFSLTSMYRAMFLNLVRQFTHSFYLLNALSLSASLRHSKPHSSVRGIKTSSFKIAQSTHKLLFL